MDLTLPKLNAGAGQSLSVILGWRAYQICLEARPFINTGHEAPPYVQPQHGEGFHYEQGIQGTILNNLIILASRQATLALYNTKDLTRSICQRQH